MANERRLSVGSMFSGMCAEAYALKALNVSFNHLFAIDHDKFVCQFIRQNHLTKQVLQQDARSIDLTTLPCVDIFLVSPPCQCFSSLGYQKDQNNRAELYKVALEYTRLKRPKAFVLENVPAFAKTPQFKHLINCLKSLYSTVKHEILNSACFGSIQARKRLFVVASDADVALPTPRETKGIPLASVLDNATHPRLNAKAIAYLERRKKWGVKIYRRDFVGHVGTIPRSYGHQISWKHVIEEEKGRLRNLTANEAFRIMGYDPSKLVFGKLSKRQRFYLAGNAIELNTLKEVLAAICKTIVG